MRASPQRRTGVTLSGTPANGNSTFTCSGSDCALAANTTYFVVTSATGSNASTASTTFSADEDLQPSGNGWSLADETLDYTTNAWQGNDVALNVSISATAAASASLTATATTLTIGNYTGSWHYQANTGPHATCQGPVTTTSQAISGLTGGASYTYKAYADSACTTANLLATAAAFTAPVVNSVSNLDKAAAQTYPPLSSGDYAQEFTTGTNTGGYTLTSVPGGLRLRG